MADIDLTAQADTAAARREVEELAESVEEVADAGERAGQSAGDAVAGIGREALVAFGPVVALSEALLGLQEQADQSNRDVIGVEQTRVQLGLASRSEAQAVVGALPPGVDERAVQGSLIGTIRALQEGSEEDLRRASIAGFDRDRFLELDRLDQLQRIADLSLLAQGDEQRETAIAALAGETDIAEQASFGRALLAGGQTLRQRADRLAAQGFGFTEQRVDESYREFLIEQEADIIRQRNLAEASGIRGLFTRGVEGLADVPLVGAAFEYDLEREARRQAEQNLNVNITIQNGDIRADISEAERTDQLNGRDSSTFRRPR